jgi:hypothetical protein
MAGMGRVERPSQKADPHAGDKVRETAFGTP